jgi:hypothetical protein
MDEREHTSRLLTRGLEMGLLHVLMGPDHLSALATLSVGNAQAVVLGIRWGLGHSAALVIVTCIFLALKGNLDLHKIGRYCDVVVGVFMIILGISGIFQARLTYKEKQQKKVADVLATVSTKDFSLDIEIPDKVQVRRDSNTTKISSLTSMIDDDKKEQRIPLLDADGNANHIDTCGMKCWQLCRAPSSLLIDMRDPFTQKIVAFSIGVVHGVAGPGGVLGVLPAVEMHDAKSSMIYLSSFVMASTASMGVFSGMYGAITKHLGTTTETAEYSLCIFSSGLSVIVGIVWTTLASMNRLQDFFD